MTNAMYRQPTVMSRLQQRPTSANDRRPKSSYLVKLECMHRRSHIVFIFQNQNKSVRIGFLWLVLVLTSLTSRVSRESILNVPVSVVLFSSAAETAVTGTNAYSESSRFTGVSLVDANDRSNSRTKTGGIESSPICSLTTSGTSVSGTWSPHSISSACEGVTWLVVVRGRAWPLISARDRTVWTDYRRPDSGPEIIHVNYNGG